MGLEASLLAGASAALGAMALADAPRGPRLPCAPTATVGEGPSAPAERRRDPLRWVGRLPPRGGLARRPEMAGIAPSELERAVGRARLLALGVVGLGMLLGLPPPACLLLGPAVQRTSLLSVTRREAERRRAAARELSVFLDLVASGVAAGLTGPLAVRHATGVAVGPLGEELAAALRRVELGGRWREEILVSADALGLPDLRRAVVALEASPVGAAEAIGEVAREVRDGQRAAAAERARTAPVKMLFPLVFLVLPAFLLLTVAPVLVATLQSIR